MNTDSLVDEIRKYREEHARSCNYDLKCIVEDIQRGEQRLREEGWTFAPAGTYGKFHAHSLNDKE